VSSYNGTIEVKSKPGKGSSFMIYLPQHSAKSDGTENAPDKVSKGNEQILFVDDEKEITYMGKRMLESLGYTVNIKTDGKDALKEIKSDPERYDLLVTDQAMPNMLGTELIEAARKYRPDLKVIIITGYRDSIPEKTVCRLGVSDIIIKPLILSEFSNLIREVLDQKLILEV
jgi:CheY-like chemotaxis protein